MKTYKPILYKKCAYCGKPFETRNPRRKYCPDNDGCRVMASKIKNGVPLPDFLFESVKNTIPTRLEIEIADKVKELEELKQELNKLRNDAAYQSSIKREYDKKIESLKHDHFFLYCSKPTKGIWDKEEYEEKLNEYNQTELKKLQINSEIESLIKKQKYIINDMVEEKLEQIENIEEEISAMHKGYRRETRQGSGKVVSTSDLKTRRFETYKISNNYEQVFGEPEKGFLAMVHGTAGGGKSSFSMQFADYFQNNFGNVCYFSLEEGLSKSFADKLKKYANGIKAFDTSQADKPLKIAKIAQDYDLCIIDSISDVGFSVNDIKILISKTKTSWILINQETKDGKYVGKSEMGHKVDIILKADKGKISVEKNRYKLDTVTEEIYKLF